MFELFLSLHSILRWVMLVLLLLTIFRAYNGYAKKGIFSGSDRKAALFTMISFDIQLVLGLLLYFIFSPTVKLAISDFGSAMKDANLRFWAVEHLAMMLLAWAMIHIGWVMIKKEKTDSGKHKKMLIFYLIAFLLLMVAIPWPISSHARPWLRLGY